MNPRKELIKGLAKNENIPFLLELNDLLPEILVEIKFNIIGSKLELSKAWNDYKITRNNDILLISKDEYIETNRFQFAIFVGYADHMLYGVIGPWDKKEFVKEIEILFDNCSKIGLTNWTDKNKNNWMYKYFRQNDNTLYDFIRNGQKIGSAINPFINEFFTDSLKLKNDLENINNIIKETM